MCEHPAALAGQRALVETLGGSYHQVVGDDVPGNPWRISASALEEFKRDLHEAAFELIEIPHVRQSGKNSADIRLCVDAMDLAYLTSQRPGDVLRFTERHLVDGHLQIKAQNKTGKPLRN